MIILSEDNANLTINDKVCIVIHMFVNFFSVSKVFIHIFMVANTMLCTFLGNSSLIRKMSFIIEIVTMSSFIQVGNLS